VVRNYLDHLEVGSLKIVREAGLLAGQSGLRAFVAGGCVRDLILGKKVKDLDIVIDGDAAVVAKKFASEHNGTMVKYPQFGTATVTLSGGRAVDFASVRQEIYPSPGALPVVSPGTLEADLFRRDFTINALAIEIGPERFGRLIDHYNGLNDLKARVIRVLHSKSFIDDPTRILRAVRFEQRFEFPIEPVTLGLLRQAVKRGAVNSVKPQRFFEEFRKNLKEQTAPENLNRLSQLEILKALSKDFKFDLRKLRLVREAEDALTWAHKNLKKEPVNGWLVYWMILCDGIPFERVTKLQERFAFTAVDRIKTGNAFSSADAVKMMARRRLSAGQVFAVLRSRSVEELLFIWSKNPSVRGMIQKYLLQWRHVGLKITGDDLKRLGIPSGRIFKNILDEVLYSVVDGRCRLRSQQLAYAETIYQQSQQ
jgi:tRNA nucleotidyltransferase (CCA-adding enzyme)